ncbi:glycoside hydrolase [Paenibacillus sp. IHBB 10380]|nr:glycoside hydrolase [Paenibacillus sp. IHBB 10380]
MSLEQKIGQMFICGFPTEQPDENIQTLIEDYHLGGIIYFRRNVKSLTQMKALSDSLQSLALRDEQPPLWIAIDQEGGMVARIDVEEMSSIPGNMALGATANTEYSFKAGSVNASELLSLGINMNLAPCLDINNNPMNPIIGIRSFGEDPDQVSEHGEAVIRAYQEQGLSAVGKHFPGHGDTMSDSHFGVAIIPHDMDRLRKIELKPFVKAIEYGIDAIMTAHVIFPAIEPNQIPATLSSAVLTDLLRKELGFQGLIMTDCLEMHAISQTCGISEGAIRAINAGADCILVSHTYSEQVAALEAVKKAVETGVIKESTIDDAVTRILAMKDKRLGSRYCEDGSHTNVIENQVEISGSHQSLLTEITDSVITLVKDEGQLPLKGNEPVLVIWPKVDSNDQMDQPWTHQITLGSVLNERRNDVKEMDMSLDPSLDEIENILLASQSYKQIVMATYTAGDKLSNGQRILAEKLISRNHKSLIVTSMRNPYDYKYITDVPAYICCYENTPLILQSLASVLTGSITPKGKLPVTLSDQYPIGWGIE